MTHHYDNRIRPTKAPKDAKGIASYDESDIPGLIQAAQNIREGHAKAAGTDTIYKGTSLEEMGF